MMVIMCSCSSDEHRSKQDEQGRKAGQEPRAEGGTHGAYARAAHDDGAAQVSEQDKSKRVQKMSQLCSRRRTEKCASWRWATEHAGQSGVGRTALDA